MRLDRTSHQAAAALALFATTVFAASDIPSQRLQDTGPVTGEGFGRRVAITSGRPTMIVGINADDAIAPDAGAAVIYIRLGPSPWTLHQRLVPSSLQAGDFFGWAVDLFGDVAVVGAPGDDRIMPDSHVTGIAPNRGAAYVFRRDEAGSWHLEARLEGVGTQAGDEFGGRVAVYGDTIMVSAIYHDLPCGPGTIPCDSSAAGAQDAGAVWVFRNAAGGWVHEAVLTAARPDSATYAFNKGRFGFGLALDGEQAVIGEPGANRAHHFTRTGSSWASRPLQPRFPHQQVLSQSSPGVGPGARLLDIRGMDRLPDGSLAILNGFRASRVEKMTPDGTVTTLFTLPLLAGPEETRSFDWLATDPSGNVFVTPRTKILKRSPDGTLAALAGTDEPGVNDGVGIAARFQYIRAIDADAAGNLYVLDGARVRRISPDGSVQTIAGSVSTGHVDGDAASARFSNPTSLAVGSSGTIYVSDRWYPTLGPEIQALRAVSASTGDVSTVVADFSAGFGWLDVDADGSVVFSAGWVGTIFRWSAAGGIVTVAQSVVATGPGFSGAVDGPLGVARFASKRLVIEPGGAIVFQNGLSVWGSSEQSVVSRLENGAIASVAGLDGDVMVDYALGEAVPRLTPGALYGYSVDIKGTRAVVGMPRATAPFTDVLDNGFAWVFDWATSEWSPTAPEWSPGTPIWSDQGRATERLGETVAILDGDDIALGGANGCTWVGEGVCADDSIGRSIENEVTPVRLFRSLAGHWTEVAQLTHPEITPRTGFGAALAADAPYVVAGAPGGDLFPTTTAGSVVVFDLSTFDVDLDGDSLPDEWEAQFGLSTASASGDDGPTGDPDRDGVSNADEHAAQTHPRNLASATRYLAEGAATSFFESRISVANPGATDATVLLRFLRRDGTVRSHVVTVPAQQSRKVVVSALPDMSLAEFSTVIESDQPVIVDRQMWWDRANAYGTHAEASLTAPGVTWYFAEGATHSGFDLFYLLQNPGDTSARVRVLYLQPSGEPLEKTYTVPPRSRFNVWVNEEQFPEGSGNRLLADGEISAVIEVQNGAPIIAERAMYLSGPTIFEAGHESAGASAPADRWFFAEGATGDFFDLFVLLANPLATTDAQVRATYLLPDGSTRTKTHVVGANLRFNIWVDRELFPDGQGREVAALEDTAVSVVLESTNGVPIIAERAMWWPGPDAATWHEAHNAFGSTAAGVAWGFAEGIVEGPPTNTTTYFLVANTGPADGRIRVTLMFDDSGSPVSREYDVLAQSRFSIDVRAQFPEAIGRGFGAVVESIGATPAPIVVERAMYNDALNTFWRAGSDAVGTRIR